MSPVASLIRTRRTSPWFKGNRSVLADVALTPEPPTTREILSLILQFYGNRFLNLQIYGEYPLNPISLYHLLVVDL